MPGAGETVHSVGRWRAPCRQDEGREEMLPRHCIDWLLPLAPTAREILGSNQQTFLEMHKIGPRKRSRTRHQLVGKVLSYFLLCTLSWQRALSGIWSTSLLAAPSRPATPRLERGCWEGGQMNRGCSSGYWVTQLEVKAKTANWDLLPNGMNKSVFLSFNFHIYLQNTLTHLDERLYKYCSIARDYFILSHVINCNYYLNMWVCKYFSWFFTVYTYKCRLPKCECITRLEF